MLVVMKAQATEEQISAVCQKIEELGYRAHSMPGAQRTARRAISIPPFVTSGEYSATMLPTYQRTANVAPRIASSAGNKSNQRVPEPRRIVTTDGDFDCGIFAD